jgi:hypothetical protein
MDQNGKPTTPDAPTPPHAGEPAPSTCIKIDLEYFLPAQKLMVKSQAATIMIEGVLQDAIRHVVSANVGGPLPADGIVRIHLEYEMTTDALTLDAQAPRVVVLGVLQHALGALTRNQIMQSNQVNQQAVEKRLVDLETRVMQIPQPSKLIIPGRP